MIQLNAVVIILVDQEGRMLLQQRSFDTPVMPGYWAFFGGGIDEGESPLQSVIRETLEEIEHKLTNPQFIFEQDFVLENAEGHMRVYVERFYGDKKKLKLKEGRDWGWFTSGEMQQLKMILHDRLVIKKVENHIRRKDEI